MTKEIIDILKKVQTHIVDSSDMVRTKYDNPKQLRDELEAHINKLRIGDMDSLDQVQFLFLPTATLHEHSICNGWSNEYMKLSNQFDTIIARR